MTGNHSQQSKAPSHNTLGRLRVYSEGPGGPYAPTGKLDFAILKLFSYRFFSYRTVVPWNDREPEVLEGLASTSKWPRNEAKFLASSRPRPRKTRIKSLVLKMAEKKAEIPRNSSSRPRKGRGKGKNSSPRLVLDLGKILPKVSSSTSSSPDDPSRTSDMTRVYMC